MGRDPQEDRKLKTSGVDLIFLVQNAQPSMFSSSRDASDWIGRSAHRNPPANDRALTFKRRGGLRLPVRFASWSSTAPIAGGRMRFGVQGGRRATREAMQTAYTATILTCASWSTGAAVARVS